METEQVITEPVVVPSRREFVTVVLVAALGVAVCALFVIALVVFA